MFDRAELQKKRAAEIRSKEKVLPANDVRGRVLYKPTQVEYCLSCFGTEITPGLRLAMLYPHSEFALPIPESRFFVGTVEKVWGNPDDPIMTIKWDGGPGGSISMSCGVKQYSQFCIPLPAGYDKVLPAEKKIAAKRKRKTK